MDTNEDPLRQGNYNSWLTTEYLKQILTYTEMVNQYLTTLRKVRDILDEVEDTFVKYPEVDKNIYKNFEKQVIDANIVYIDKFLDAFANNDFEGMNKIHDDLIETVIAISEKFAG